MLNILPLSILQAWSLWPDFDGAYAEPYQDGFAGEAMDMESDHGPLRAR